MAHISEIVRSEEGDKFNKTSDLIVWDDIMKESDTDKPTIASHEMETEYLDGPTEKDATGTEYYLDKTTDKKKEVSKHKPKPTIASHEVEFEFMDGPSEKEEVEGIYLRKYLQDLEAGTDYGMSSEEEEDDISLDVPEGRQDLASSPNEFETSREERPKGSEIDPTDEPLTDNDKHNKTKSRNFFKFIIRPEVKEQEQIKQEEEEEKPAEEKENTEEDQTEDKEEDDCKKDLEICYLALKSKSKNEKQKSKPLTNKFRDYKWTESGEKVKFR